MRDTIYSKYIKRILDILISASAIAVFAIPLLFIMLLIEGDMGRPVLFKQRRIGKGERIFTMYKLRSMKNQTDEAGIPLPDAQRVTKLGRFIRSTSIDELPNLVNVLKGDMSIVGPRPLPENYLPWFYENERARHAVRGGITGLAQVNGRNMIGWEERFDYDIEYINNISLALDAHIIFLTIKKVFERKDIGMRGVNSPPDFNVYRSGKTELELMKMSGKR